MPLAQNFKEVDEKINNHQLTSFLIFKITYTLPVINDPFNNFFDLFQYHYMFPRHHQQSGVRENLYGFDLVRVDKILLSVKARHFYHYYPVQHSCRLKPALWRVIKFIVSESGAPGGADLQSEWFGN